MPEEVQGFDPASADRIVAAVEAVEAILRGTGVDGFMIPAAPPIEVTVKITGAKVSNWYPAEFTILNPEASGLYRDAREECRALPLNDASTLTQDRYYRGFLIGRLDGWARVVLAEGGDGWQLARISDQHGGKPPRYTCVAIELEVDDTVDPPTFEYVDKSPTVTFLNCFRSPSYRWDELSGDHTSATDPVLRKINVNQAVLVRQVIAPSDGDPEADPPTFAHDGACEMIPWGGTRGANFPFMYRVCGECVGSAIRIKMAIRKVSIYGSRDFRALFKPPAKSDWINVENDVPNSGPEE